VRTGPREARGRAGTGYFTRGQWRPEAVPVQDISQDDGGGQRPCQYSIFSRGQAARGVASTAYSFRGQERPEAVPVQFFFQMMEEARGRASTAYFSRG